MKRLSQITIALTLLAGTLLAEPSLDTKHMTSLEYRSFCIKRCANLENQHEPAWLLTLKGFDADEVVTLTMKRIWGEVSPINMHPSGFQRESVITPRGFLPGEPIEITCRSKKNTVTKTIIPNPLRAESPSGKITMEARLHCADPAMYSIRFAGVEPGKNARFKSKSGKEEMNSPCIPGAIISYTPGVLGEEGGVALASIATGDGDVCMLQVPWGMELGLHHAGLIPIKD